MVTGPVLDGWFVTDVGAIVVEHLEQVSEFDWRSEVRHDRHRVPLSASCHISTGSDPRPQQTEDQGAPRLACSDSPNSTKAHALHGLGGQEVAGPNPVSRGDLTCGDVCRRRSRTTAVGESCSESYGTNPGTTLLPVQPATSALAPIRRATIAYSNSPRESSGRR
jgi:hypothetical protein